MWIPILGLLIGLIIGSALNVPIPGAYAKYLSIAVLAALDSAFGGVRSIFDERFDAAILLTGFFANALLAALLAYLGDQLGVDLYLAAVFAFGVRLFQNLAIIRRELLSRWVEKRKIARAKRDNHE
ncbi:MAG TPA: small basic family protein [Syntrophaceticus sp.]|jgi:small basic protein|uniref:Putative integral inner membrane protein n=1 Tax=Syntrophaceticus schinkii TaxID=499207 RepID=A0A0B7MBD2_9FIRM|nr:small basic family protein [Syntrophaceticus schinkii]HHY29846.1 small basic family protein [Syntrophaceticus sp.]MDD2360506.1 small basic family protein [Syntrophaceticus schinkii]MDD4261472.1 small basic family protein [Syntrophaceticus schinkii]MDD4674789.1 small basic family protein [Syntrophaceticus schinkii]CEO87804.1 putative integral inner membrane protein [Syntrophaceticus schinkii]